MDPKLRTPVVWLAAAGALLILFSLQLMGVIARPFGLIAGLLVLAGGWLALRGGRR